MGKRKSNKRIISSVIHRYEFWGQNFLSGRSVIACPVKSLYLITVWHIVGNIKVDKIK